MHTQLFAQQALPPTLGREVFAESHADQFSSTLNHTQALRELQSLASRYAIQPVLTIDAIRRANLAALIDEIGSAVELASRLEVQPSQVSQWKTGAKDSKTGKRRQLSSESCRRIEEVTKKPEGWMDQQHPSGGLSIRPEDHDLSQPLPDHEPPLLTWEFLLSTEIADLPSRFRVAMPDDAMAPDTPRGTVLIFDRQKMPAFGAGVLVQDATGARHVRRYAQGQAGAWKAEARNSAYLTLHSSDGVQVLAVVTAIETSQI